MDCKLLGLQRNPFGDVCDESSFYRSRDRERILGKMKAAVGRDAGVVVLVGEAGIGKTTLAREFLRRLDPACRTALVSCAAKPVGELIRQVQAELGMETDSSGRRGESAAGLHGPLERETNATVLVLDSAEQLSPEGFEQVEALSRAQSGAKGAIVLVGRPELLRGLQDSAARGLRQRVWMADKIDPWSESQTAEYLRHRIQAAGGDVDELFTSDAVTTICRCAEGMPGAVDRIGSAAIEAAVQTGAGRITAELVGNAIPDRSVDQSRVPPAPTPAADDADSRFRSTGIEDWTDELPLPTEQSMDDAGMATQRLSSVADRLNAATESVRERTLLLTAGLQTAEDVYQRLDQLSREVTGLTCGFEKTADTRLAQLRQAMDECKQGLEDARRAGEGVAADLERQGAIVLERSKVAHESLDRHAEAVRRIEEQLSHARQEHERRSERASETLGRLEWATQQAASDQKQLQSLMDRLDVARDKTEDLLGATDRTLHQREECLHTIARAIDEMAQQTIRTAESAKTEMEEAGQAALAAGRQEVDGLLGKVRHAIEEADQAADNARSRVRTTESKLREAEQTVQQHVESFRASIDAAGETADRIKTEIGAAADEAVRTSEQRIQHQADALRAAIDKAGETADQIKTEIGAASDDAVRAAEQRIQHQVDAVHDIVKQAKQSQETLAVDIGAADAKGEQLASHISAANDVATRLAEANAQSQRVTAELGRREASLGRLGEALASQVKQGTERIGQAGEEARSRVAEAVQEMRKEIAAGEQQTESLRQCNDEACGTLEQLTRLSDRARDEAQTLERTIQPARELNESARARIETLARHRDEADAVREHLEASTAAAKECSQDLVAQTDAACAATAEQQELCDCADERSTALAERIERGGQTAEHLDAVRDGAIEVENRLQKRVEHTESLLERLTGLVDRLDRRQEEIAAQDEALRRLRDEREALELRVQRAGDTVESLRLELSTLLAEPQRMVCKAQTQALKLHDACRATQEVCSKLSKASLDAGRRIEQLNRLEATADALKSWVDETARAQQRLSATLGSPSSPPLEARPQGRLVELPTVRREPADAATALAGGSPRGQSVAPRRPASIPDEAERKKEQVRRIDRLIREARQQGESTGPELPVAVK